MCNMHLITPRLKIMPLCESEWMDIQEICSDFESSQYSAYDYPLPTEAEAVKQLVKIWTESGNFFAVHRIDETEAIGYVCDHINGEIHDIGFAFKKRFQGQGYAYEAVKAVIAWLGADCGVSSLSAGLALQNLPSLRLVQKLGFVLSDTEERSFRSDDAGKPFICQCGNFSLTTLTKREIPY